MTKLLFGKRRLQGDVGNDGMIVRVVGVRDVLLQHSMSVEEGAVERDGGTHDSAPLLRIAIVKGKNGRLEPVVKTRDFMFLGVAVGNRPAGNPFNPALYPPTIKNTEAGDADKRRLHSAG